MTGEERDMEPMAWPGAGRYRQGALWWKAAIGLLLSGGLILGAVWLRLESRPLERLARPLGSSLALAGAAPRVQPQPESQPGTLTLRLPADL